MIVLKSAGKVIGGKLTNAEKKAMDIEIRKGIAENTRKHEMELTAMILRQLRKTYGFGEERLRRFVDNFDPDLDTLLARYETGDGSEPWLCTRELKEDGIDIEQWFNDNQRL